MYTILENLILSAYWLNIIGGLLLLIFGVIGSLLTIYVFTRPAFQKNPSVRYLLAGSIANLIQLINTLLPRILSDGFGISVVQSNTQYCQARTCIAATASLAALSFPCWASFDPCVSTSRNAATRQYWTSKKVVYGAIFSTSLFWLLAFLPTGIFIRAVGNSCVGTNPLVTYIYSYGMFPLTYVILPMVSVIYFNIRTVSNLRETRFVGLNQLNNRLARQVRRMLIPQLIILIISGIPYSIQGIYGVATLSIGKDPVRLAAENLIYNIVRSLFYLNYVCSFYIYMIKSSEVRRVLRCLIWKQNTILPLERTVNLPKMINRSA